MGAPDPEAARRRLLAAGAMLAVHAAVLLPIAGVRMPTAARETIMVGVLAQVPAGIETPVPTVPLPPPPEPAVAPVRLPRASVAPAATVVPPATDSIAAAPSDMHVTERAPSTAMPAPIVAPAAPAARAAVEPPRYHADYLNNPQPPYPLLSRRMREEGTVLLHVLVDTDGHPAEVRLQASSGHERLDLAARAAVQEWRFVPARQRGQNVAGWVEVPIQFKLEK